MAKRLLSLIASLLLATSLAACSNSDSESESLVIYSGRAEEYMGTLFEDFTKETGIKLDIRYGDSAALAAQILEEGENSPADLFISQDAGALGAISGEGLLATLDDAILNRVNEYFRSQNRDWVGLTGRVRILAYSPKRVTALPKTVDDLTKSEWKGRLGIAPTNASFQAFVTAMIQTRGEDETEKWLRAIVANSPKYFEKNSLIVEAIDAGEIDAGLVNHYYIYEVAEELGREIDVKNSFFAPGDIGNLINASGLGILATSKKNESAKKLIQFLLSDTAQQFFVDDVKEYSAVDSSLSPGELIPLSEIKAPKVDLAALKDLKRTQSLLIKVGLL
jgi:iron(III) transport system substrate-binding protein